MSLDEFVEELSLVREENPREPDAPPEDSSNAVKIMTVHSAKGLEFPVVFVAAIHKGVDTGVPAVAFSRHHGLGARWRNPASGEDKDDLFQHALRQEWKRREEEESSRLLYVAMTRAENHLVLSFSATGRKPANWDKLVCERLALDSAAPQDGIVEYKTRENQPWKARIRTMLEAPPLHAAARPLPEQDHILQVALPVVPAQHDSNATVTGLSIFGNCPRKYYLSRYLGFDGHGRKQAEHTGEPVPVDAAEFGSQVHTLLAGNPCPDATPEARRLAEVFTKNLLGQRAARATRIAREFDFVMAMEDLVINGQVDLWFEEGGELVVVDYKTDDVTSTAAHHRARDYAMQLRLYALAVERVAGRTPDRAFLHFLRPNTVVEVDLTPTLIESPEQTVRDFLEAQSKLDFPLNEGDHCKRCAFYRDLCPAGQAPARP
jgi:ATP-dependent exoDNAse (exonuclease V) beta subunit